MDAIDKVQLLAELDHEHCALNHGPETNPADYPAVDYIVMPVGYHEDEDKDVAVRDLVVPVCRECVEALQGEVWTLLYCYECSESHWVHRKLAKNDYRHHVLWLKGCPDCSEKFGGLYFNDSATVPDVNELVFNVLKSAA